MRDRAYSAHNSIRDHRALRCMSRCPDRVVSLKQDLQCLSHQASLVLIRGISAKILAKEKNATDKFRGVIVGSTETTSHHRTWDRKRRLAGVIRKNNYEKCDVECIWPGYPKGFSLSQPSIDAREGGIVWTVDMYISSPRKVVWGALGSVANHPLEKEEVIADSLQKQFEPNTEAESDRFTARTQRKIKGFLDAPTCLDLDKTTPGEVQEYIKKLKINKSHGLDLITNRILKNLPLKFVLFIVMLFNLLMENCHFLKNWKTAVVVPILKPNFDDTQPQNYRPISLLSSLNKAYEFVLLNRLNQHCIARNIIIPEQHGFVTQCSTVTQLLRVTELIRHDFQNNQATGILFVDIAKAFDKIWHDGLLSKMMQHGFRTNSSKLYTPT
ncbi:RNA-directed DNA polymerase from mobile element jockey [Trichonephila clavipes]|nr:RNA-directed DNA polymerase from mobile element jockey [Trichonephila clavipes]